MGGREKLTFIYWERLNLQPCNLMQAGFHNTMRGQIAAWTQPNSSRKILMMQNDPQSDSRKSAERFPQHLNSYGDAWSSYKSMKIHAHPHFVEQRAVEAAAETTFPSGSREMGPADRPAIEAEVTDPWRRAWACQ